MTDEPLWGALLLEGADYDPNTPLAQERRKKGQCGACGHEEAHGRMGCSCGCQVIELSPEACAKIAEFHKREESPPLVKPLPIDE